ncbi:uncharacterized protein ACNS7B_008209 [Menidia menidia]
MYFRALSKVVDGHPHTWDEYLDAVMFGIRTKKQITTQYSPYFLMFGREARYPSEVPEHYMIDGAVEDVIGVEELAEDLKIQESLRSIVSDNVSKKQEKAKGRAQQIGTVFKPGDRVWRQNTRSQQRKDVQDAFTGKNVFVLLSKVNAYKLFYFDINKIGPDIELESQSINAFMAVIVKDYNSQNTGQAAFIDSFAMTAMWQGKSPRLKKMNPMNYEIILGINNQHHHWTLVVIYPQEKKSLFLNPLGESKQDIQKCLQITRAFMRKKGCNVSRWTCDTVKHPKQQDSTSCGVFSLKFAEKILSKEVVDFPVSNEAVYSMRLEIAVRLILNSDDLKDLCHFCGEMESDSDVNWIQCDLCLRWFHQACVGSPPTEKTYHCFACLP